MYNISVCFFSSDKGDCLKNLPLRDVDMTHVQVAGDQYDADQQCLQVFGSNFQECSSVYVSMKTTNIY